MASYPTRELSEIAELFDSLHQTPKYVSSGYAMIRVTDIRRGYVETSNAVRVDEATYLQFSKKHRPQVGDILFSRVGSCGNSAYVYRDEDFCLGQNTVCISPNQELVEPAFLYGAFNSDLLRNQIESFVGGASQGTISLKSIKKLKIPSPSLLVQQRIAGIVSAYDELIENGQRRIKILESMARALYREWFVHFRFSGHESHPGAESSLGEIPQGWKAIPFRNLLDSMSGGDWGSEQSSGRDIEEVAVVRGTDFHEVAYGEQLRVPVRFIKPSSLKTRRLQAGDVIIENSINAKSRCIGTTLIVDDHVLKRLGRDAIAASFCKVFRPHDPRLAPLVHLHIRHLREDARMEYYQNVAANGIGNFQAQKFANEEQLVLPQDEALRVKLIDPIASLFQNIGVLSSKLANLRRTRDLLLPRLLSGQIEVEAA